MRRSLLQLAGRLVKNPLVRSVGIACGVALLIGASGCRHDRAGATRMVVVESATRPSDQPAAHASGQPIRVIVDDTSQPRGNRATIESMVGRKCRVQFRRDALGLVADAPTPPLSEGLFKRPVYLDGTLSTAGSDGIVLQADTGDVWIPWTSILLIEARQ